MAPRRHHGQVQGLLCGGTESEESGVTRCCVPTGECLRVQQQLTPNNNDPMLISLDDLRDTVRVTCNNEACTVGRYMHRECFEQWEQTVLAYLKTCGRARSWSERQRHQNLWTKKGYDLAFKACGCKCGRGHLKKDLDWMPPPPTSNIFGRIEEIDTGKKKKRRNRNSRPTLAISAHHAAPNEGRGRAGSLSSSTGSSSPPATASEPSVSPIHAHSKKKSKFEFAERVRYSDSDPNLDSLTYPCHHESCNSITLRELRLSRAKFYEHPDKVKQDTKISHCLHVKSPKRKRSRRPRNPKHHSMSVKYKLWTRSGKKDVCQKMFLSVLGVSQRRVQTVAKKMKSGDGIVENRGGDRRSRKNITKKLKVMEFIKSLKGTESHYGRAKSRRIYLPSELNITKLAKAYNDSVDLSYKVNYKFFCRIFNGHFNIGFGSPATDVCGFCVRHRRQVELSQNPQEKTKIITNLRVHKLRAKQFYTMMKEDSDDSLSFCFDLQQVQLLPKVPIGDAFYAQQVSLYSFCITDISSKTPIFYSWLETQAGRGSIEVGSALYDFLLKLEIPDHVRELRLYSDGCGGQNKNSHIIHMLMIWLHRRAPPTLQCIRMCFPVRGHSYLPADRAFGRAEKLIRAQSTIKSPEKYWELYSQVGEVRKLGMEWTCVYNFKEALTVLKKVDGISEAKRIFITRTKNRGVSVKTEQYYRNNDESKKYETLLKKNKKIENIVLPELPLYREIKTKKVKSLTKLLVELATENWRNDPELAWLNPILPENVQNHDEEGEDGDDSDHDQEELCQCQEDDGGVRL